MSSNCQQCHSIFSDKYSLKIEYQGEIFIFDCFQCAIEKLAPHCENCGTQILGKGTADSIGEIYCGPSCQSAATQ